MSDLLSEFISIIISEEIDRCVADAAREGNVVSPTAVAAQVKRAYPAFAISKREIADQVLHAAAKANVAVEIGKYHEAA